MSPSWTGHCAHGRTSPRSSLPDARLTLTRPRTLGGDASSAGATRSDRGERARRTRHGASRARSDPPRSTSGEGDPGRPRGRGDRRRLRVNPDPDAADRSAPRARSPPAGCRSNRTSRDRGRRAWNAAPTGRPCSATSRSSRPGAWANSTSRCRAASTGTSSSVAWTAPSRQIAAEHDDDATVAVVNHSAAIRVWTAARARNIEPIYAARARLENAEVVVVSRLAARSVGNSRAGAARVPARHRSSSTDHSWRCPLSGTFDTPGEQHKLATIH